jgi:CPA1 family monovalent cation:H+ antiporter
LNRLLVPPEAWAHRNPRSEGKPFYPAVIGIRSGMVNVAPILVLLLIAIVLVLVAARLRVPYTVGLVVFGVVIGFFARYLPVLDLKLTAASLFSPGLFFDILLPPIVFEAAIHIDIRLLRKRAPLILFLVVVGVIFTTVFTGVVVSYLAALPLVAALLMASILSPTDSIAVVELFRRLRVPPELSTIVDTESLFNDGVGVVLFLVVLGIAATGNVALGPATIQFFRLSGGGLLIGLAVAGGVFLLHRRLNDPPVETALTVVVAYGTFLLANALGTSGIVATAAAGIGVGAWTAPRAMSDTVRSTVSTFWRVVVYIANSLIFLSIGLVIDLRALLDYLPLIAIVFLVLFAGRTLFVYAHYPLSKVRRGHESTLPSAWYGTLTLAGVRGAIPVVLALSLLGSSVPLAPGTLTTILAVVLGVVIVSVIGNNLAAQWYAFRYFPEAPSDASALTEGSLPAPRDPFGPAPPVEPTATEYSRPP